VSRDVPEPKQVVRPLLRWYARARRDLPWRGSRDPYRVWVSEIMLQQTQVERVREYFMRFTARFPTVASLARAREADVLKLWEGLGYYRRARQLHAAGRRVRVRPVEEGRVADRPHAHAAALVGDPLPERRPFPALGADETQLHELVGPQQPLQLLEEGGRDAGLADPDVVGEGLAEAAQVGTLGAREREFVHPGSVAGAQPAAKLEAYFAAFLKRMEERRKRGADNSVMSLASTATPTPVAAPPPARSHKDAARAPLQPVGACCDDDGDDDEDDHKINSPIYQRTRKLGRLGAGAKTNRPPRRSSLAGQK